MSYDLGVFFTRRPLTGEDALDRYVGYRRGEYADDPIEAGACVAVAGFLDRLRSMYPLPQEAGEYIGYDCPWSADHDVSDGHVMMSMVHSRAPEVVPVVVDMAADHGLVCVDPQQAGVLTAPWGVVVAQTQAIAGEVGDHEARGDAAFVEVLDEALKPRGFTRRSRTWRKNDKNAVIVVKTIEDCGLIEGYVCVWFKPLGPVDPLTVMPDRNCHIQDELGSHLLTDESRARLLRAFSLECDYVESVEGISAGGKRDQSIEDLYDYDPNVPITMQWRAHVLRRVLREYWLPLFDRVDAGQYQELMAERSAANNPAGQ